MLDQQVTDWVEELCRATGVDRAAVDVAAILDLAKDAAHGVARPAAPLTTFVAGYLAGRAITAAGGDAARGDAAGGRVAAGMVPADAAAMTRAVLAEIGALIPPPPSLDQMI